jgi:HEAT repeat protein
MKLGKLITVLVCVAVVVVIWLWWRAGRLTAEEQAAWDRFIAKHMANRERASEDDINAVVEIGDKVIPQVESYFGRAASYPVMKSDVSLVIILGRIGTPRAVEAILKVVRHDYPGRIGNDREIAADALVWLGATEGIPVLEAAIEDHRRRVDEALAAETGQMAAMRRVDYDIEIEQIERHLADLKAGRGIRDTKKQFPYDIPP